MTTNIFKEEPHLVQVYTATLNEDEFVDQIEVTEEDTSDEKRSRRDKFLLSSVSKNLDQSDPKHSVHLERLDNLKNQVLERVKTTYLNKSKPRTGTSKRRLSLSILDSDRSSSRPRNVSPPPPPKLPDGSSS